MRHDVALRRTSDIGVDLVKQWEGLKLEAYLCPAGVWTIGYGHTRTVKPGTVINEQRADELLREDLRSAEQAVQRAVQVSLSSHQFDALVSWTFNLGAGALERSTLLRKLNAGDYEAVPAEMLRWVKARVNGKLQRVQGLVNRRNAEIGLWARGSFVESTSAPVSPERPMPQGREIAGGAVGAAAALVPAAAAAPEVVDSLGGLSGPIAWGVAVVLVVAAVGGLGFAVYRYSRRWRS
ncbi:MAG: lysozyme [Pseudomonadota bacterium]